jgi:abhydrolase domain-containing protein 6
MAALSALARLLLAANTRRDRRRARLRSKVLLVDGRELHHDEGGDGQPLVLLHGLADDRTSFARTAAGLTHRYRVILPDLDGHGDNAPVAGADYSVRGQVDRLHAFIEARGLSSFHLGGNSMGGHVAAAYALRHPGRARSLILVNAAGLQVDDHVVYAGFGERMATVADLEAVLDRVYHRRPRLPGFIARHLVERIGARFDHTNAMVEAVKAGADFALDDRIARVSIPTLVLWGRHDVVVRFNVAEAYRDRIGGARLVLLDDAAHSPQLEVPDRVAEEVARFLAGLTGAPAATAADSG